MRTHIAIFLTCLLISVQFNKPTDTTLLTNHFWFDNFPSDHWERYRLYIFFSWTDEKSELMLLHMDGSDSEWTTSFGRWFPETPSLTIKWLQNKSESKTQYKITRGTFGMFDLKLELISDSKNGGKPSVFYSRVDNDFNSQRLNTLKQMFR